MNIDYKGNSINLNFSNLDLTPFPTLIITLVTTSNRRDNILTITFDNGDLDVRRIDRNDYKGWDGSRHIFTSGISIYIKIKKPVLFQLKFPDPTLTVYIDLV